MSDRMNDVLRNIDQALTAAEYDLAPSTLEGFLNAGMYMWQLHVIHNAAPEFTDAAVRLLTEAKRRMQPSDARSTT